MLVNVMTEKIKLMHTEETLVAASVWPGNFPNCTGPCTSRQLHRTWRGTSRGSLQEEGSVGKDSEGDRAWRYYNGEIEVSVMR